MGAREYAVRIVRVERHRPDPAAGQLHVLGINASPSVPGVSRNVESAVFVECTRDKYLVRVVWVDENARVVS